MSNKTSDKDVANIEELIQEYKTYNDLDEIQDLSIYVNALEHILAEREQMLKAINTVEKEKGEWIEECVQKDKRIQELEADLYSSNEIIADLTDSIPKQAVIDKIKEYDKKMEEDAGHPNWVVTDRIVMNVLQELLETK